MDIVKSDTITFHGGGKMDKKYLVLPYWTRYSVTYVILIVILARAIKNMVLQ